MAKLCGIDVIALTDHNSAKNCPAFFEAAENYGVVPIAGMELTTAEDIHLVCLFENLEDAMKFDEAVNKYRIPFKNRVDIFGEQMIMDENDEVIGVEENLLSNATTITVDEAPTLVSGYGGICYPAHIDREANGIVATLGVFPEFPYFPCAEFHDSDRILQYCEKYPIISDKPHVVSSDAHYLWDISGRLNKFELEGGSAEEVRRQLFERLKGL